MMTIDEHGLGTDHGANDEHGPWVEHGDKGRHGYGVNYGAEHCSKPVVFVAAIDFAFKIT